MASGRPVARSAGRFEIHTRRTDELRDDDAFGAIDDEGSLVGHLREIAQEDILFDRLGDIGTRQQDRHIQRAGVGQIAFNTLFNRVLGIAKPVLQTPLLGFRAPAGKEKLHPLVVGFDRRNLMEEIAQTFFLSRSKESSWMSIRLGRSS